MKEYLSTMLTFSCICSLFVLSHNLAAVITSRRGHLGNVITLMYLLNTDIIIMSDMIWIKISLDIPTYLVGFENTGWGFRIMKSISDSK